MDQDREEAQLIRKAKNDPEAFGALYDRHYSRILRFTISRTGSVELAQDLTAETFFQALKHLWRFRLSGRPFSAWLYRIAIAQIARHYRDRARHAELSLEECPELISPLSGGTSPHASWSEVADADAAYVRRLLGRLKPVEQNVLTLRYFEDLPLAQIAASLGLRENTVKSHLKRGLERLRRLAAQEHPPTPFAYDPSPTRSAGTRTPAAAGETSSSA